MLYLIPGLRKPAEMLSRIAGSPPVAFLGIFGQMLHPPHPWARREAQLSEVPLQAEQLP